jgi:hypothetical protein
VLGVEVLELKNKCLLSKWLFKLLTEKGMWQELLHKKYIKDKMLSQVQEKPTDSPFWKGLIRVKNDFFSRGSFKVENGTSVHFWEDIWLGNMPLADQYPSLYNIVQRKNVLVADVLSHNPLNIEFWRVLNGNKWNDWLNLCHRLMTVNLSNQQDKFAWKLTKSGVFTVKSIYLDLMNKDAQFLHKYLWRRFNICLSLALLFVLFGA